MILTEKTKNAILELQKKYPEKRSALIPALHLAQAEHGYLPLEIQEQVALLFDLDTTEINGIVTFYDMFFDRPMGKHLIHVCKNVCCMLRGSDHLIDALCHKLQIDPGGTTTDGEYSLIPSECLAACDRAPMMIVDDKVVGLVKEEDLDQILADAKKGPGHPSPIENIGEEHA